jgi:uncharacterized protein (DUF885 family)
MRNRTLKFVGLIVLLLANGPATSAFGKDASVPQTAVAMAELVRQYQADEQSLREAFRLPASTASLERTERLQTAWLARLESVNFDALDRPGKLDHILLRNQIRQSLDAIARQRKRLAEINPLVNFRDTILDLELARRRGRPIDCRATAEKLAKLAEKVKHLRERVEWDGKPKPQGQKRDAKEARGKTTSLAVSPAVALRAAEVVKGLRDTLDGWYKQYNNYLPEFDWWIKQPYGETQKQLDGYAKLLREDIARQRNKPDDPLVGQPIGAEALAAGIRFEFLPYTADELIAIGQRELSWCEGQMKAQSRRMGLGDDWKAALAKVKADDAPPGHQAELIAQIADEAAAFVKQRKLVNVPPLCQETWRLTMMSPEQLTRIPYAAYAGQRMMVAYAQQGMNQEDKLMVMRGNNRHFMRLVTPHELIPGHHLQGFYDSRYNTHRQVFATPFYVEGWALYWELRLYDLGWAKTPEDRIGMLFWRMTRAARIIVSLNYHLGRMTPAEMVAFLTARVGHERFGATAEVRRFIQAAPLYQVGYLIGGLQLVALHKELVGGGKMSEEQFHDAVLKEGPIPIEPLRNDLLGLPLRADMKPGWRFGQQ